MLSHLAASIRPSRAGSQQSDAKRNNDTGSTRRPDNPINHCLRRKMPSSGSLAPPQFSSQIPTRPRSRSLKSLRYRLPKPETAHPAVCRIPRPNAAGPQSLRPPNLDAILIRPSSPLIDSFICQGIDQGELSPTADPFAGPRCPSPQTPAPATSNASSLPPAVASDTCSSTDSQSTESGLSGSDSLSTSATSATSRPNGGIQAAYLWRIPTTPAASHSPLETRLSGKSPLNQSDLDSHGDLSKPQIPVLRSKKSSLLSTNYQLQVQQQAPTRRDRIGNSVNDEPSPSSCREPLPTPSSFCHAPSSCSSAGQVWRSTSISSNSSTGGQSSVLTSTSTLSTVINPSGVPDQDYTCIGKPTGALHRLRSSSQAESASRRQKLQQQLFLQQQLLMTHQQNGGVNISSVPRPRANPCLKPRSVSCYQVSPTDAESKELRQSSTMAPTIGRASSFAARQPTGNRAQLVIDQEQDQEELQQPALDDSHGQSYHRGIYQHQDQSNKSTQRPTYSTPSNGARLRSFSSTASTSQSDRPPQRSSSLVRSGQPCRLARYSSSSSVLLTEDCQKTKPTGLTGAQVAQHKALAAAGQATQQDTISTSHHALTPVTQAPVSPTPVCMSPKIPGEPILVPPLAHSGNQHVYSASLNPSASDSETGRSELQSFPIRTESREDLLEILKQLIGQGQLNSFLTADHGSGPLDQAPKDEKRSQLDLQTSAPETKALEQTNTKSLARSREHLRPLAQKKSPSIFSRLATWRSKKSTESISEVPSSFPPPAVLLDPTWSHGTSTQTSDTFTVEGSPIFFPSCPKTIQARQMLLFQHEKHQRVRGLNSLGTVNHAENPKTVVAAGPKARPEPPGIKVFGAQLRNSGKSSCLTIIGGQKHLIPIVAFSTIEEIFERGMRVPGLMVTEGNEEEVNKLITIFETGPGFGDGIDLGSSSIYVLGSLLKRYLYELPEPLMNRSSVELIWLVCLQAGSTQVSDNHQDSATAEIKRKCGVVQCMMRLMNSRAFSLLVYLIAFLAQIPLFPQNQLAFRTSVSIFGPLLMGPRRRDGETSDQGSEQQSKAVLAWILNHWNLITDGLLDEKFSISLLPSFHQELAKKTVETAEEVKEEADIQEAKIGVATTASELIQAEGTNEVTKQTSSRAPICQYPRRHPLQRLNSTVDFPGKVTSDCPPQTNLTSAQTDSGALESNLAPASIDSSSPSDGEEEVEFKKIGEEIITKQLQLSSHLTLPINEVDLERQDTDHEKNRGRTSPSEQEVSLKPPCATRAASRCSARNIVDRYERTLSIADCCVLSSVQSLQTFQGSKSDIETGSIASRDSRVKRCRSTSLPTKDFKQDRQPKSNGNRKQILTESIGVIEEQEEVLRQLKMKLSNLLGQL